MRIAMRAAVGLSIALMVGACSTIQTIQQVATAEVPASVVVPTANAFNVLKGTATNYGRYCIANRMPVPICSAGNRRAVIKFVRSGTAARNQLEDSVTNGVPAAASIYNVLVAAVQGLQGTPVAIPQFGAQ